MKGFVYVLYLIFTEILVVATSDELYIKFEEKEILRKLEHLTSVVKQVNEENKQLRSTVNVVLTDNKQLRLTVNEVLTDNKQLRSTVNEVLTDNKQFRSTVNEVLTDNKQLRLTVNEVLTDNKQLRSTVDEIELENKRLQNGYRKIVNTNNELQAEMQNMKGCCSHEQQRSNSLTSFKRLLVNNGDADGQIVAFTAAVNRHLTLGPNQAVQFEKIITNVGNAYDPRHGHMIVPIKGLYLISVTIFNKAEDTEYLELVKNGNTLVHFYEQGGRFTPMSQTIIVSLEKSDVVWVRNYDSATYAGHHLYGAPTELYNTFSGFLLKAL